jgi:tagaturonate reductase
MIISRQSLQKINVKELSSPQPSYFNLQEKVLQFGTGVLLRGLPGYFIDIANKQNIFNGRIVVVKSTNSGDIDAFKKQDGLYTISVKGIEEGKKVEQLFLNASISRVLSAQEEWDKILACAGDKNIDVIISNTTEVGLALQQDDSIFSLPPSSFPGKLLAFLHKRFELFRGNAESGFVIIPTELIPDNGKKLKTILNTLSALNKLDKMFIDWMNTANFFCSSLVDRIVPGKLKDSEEKLILEKLGYEDELMIIAEPYRLWAIESADEKVKEILSFHKCDDAVIIASDITIYRELKLRLLNGTHTFSCGLAVVAGFSTVREAMQNETFRSFVSRIMQDEITPAIVSKNLSIEQAFEFGKKTIDRFANPFIDHPWLNITLQFSSKMFTRNIPVLRKYYEEQVGIPALMALGFAGYILFMKPVKNEDGKVYGENKNLVYSINDDKALLVAKHWKQGNVETVVKNILADTVLWQMDLNVFPGFADAVIYNCQSITENGVETTMRILFEKMKA